MARSIKKGFFVDYHLLEKIEKAVKSGAKKPITPPAMAAMKPKGMLPALPRQFGDHQGIAQSA